MVNAVNSARNVPELGARREHAAGQNKEQVQDVRQEAARQIERHKRRLGEAGIAHASPQRPQDTSRQAPGSAPQPARAVVTEVSAVSNDAAPRTKLTAPAARPSQPQDMTASEREPQVKAVAVAVAEAARAHQDGQVTPTVQEEPESDRPQTLQSGPDAAEAEPEPAAQRAGEQKGMVELRQPTMSAGKAPPEPQAATSKHMAPVATPAAISDARGTSTVFDVPLRALGSQHSTQVSLHLASGQVVLTPSTERAAEVLLTAAQSADWVSVSDSTDERQSARRDHQPDDEDGQ
ncbi:hypothetical protein [Stenotrophomonas sp. B1-1]|uniref:hypothetical protein n=1 Tax=Stenotrophomonas sp. B1-1 TaxID=2710648 RepID=UPI0013DA694C|nr:hypothetical protein [Stenotrophomonas sp. B1-1]